MHQCTELSRYLFFFKINEIRGFTESDVIMHDICRRLYEHVTKRDDLEIVRISMGKKVKDKSEWERLKKCIDWIETWYKDIYYMNARKVGDRGLSILFGGVVFERQTLCSCKRKTKLKIIILLKLILRKIM